MDWQAVSAIGSFACALSTLVAAGVALYIGNRSNNIKVYARGYFRENKEFEAIENHPNCFSFEAVGIGNKPLYITYVLEAPSFRLCGKGAIAFLRSLRRRRFSAIGSAAPDILDRKYWVSYRLGDTVELRPGCMFRFNIPFSGIKKVQLEKEKLGIFNLSRPLRYYVVDIAGRQYKVQTGATSESFLRDDRTCTMKRVSIVSGDPLPSKKSNARNEERSIKES